MTLLFCSRISYSQIVELPLPISHPKQNQVSPLGKNKDMTVKFDEQSFERESKIVVYPSQYIRFNISIFTKGHHVFICDTLGQILYSQIKNKGSFKYRTDIKYKYFIIYDLINDTTKNIIGYNPIDLFHRNIIFGYKNKVDALINITAKIIK